jgi:hypothetical protein
MLDKPVHCVAAMSISILTDRKGIVMSVPSSPHSHATGPPKKRVSTARNIIGLLLLLALGVVVWLEYSAKFGYNGAVKALEARTQDEAKGLMDVQEAETLLGKSPDGPGIDVQDSDRVFTKKTYTWRALLRPQMLTAFYTKEATPHLHHYETEGAKYVPEPNPPVVPRALENGPATTKSTTEAAAEPTKPPTKKSPDIAKPPTKKE